MQEIVKFTTKIEQKVRSELSAPSFNPTTRLKDITSSVSIIGGLIGVGVGLVVFGFVEPYIPGALGGTVRGMLAFGGAGIGFALTSRR